MSKSTDCMEMPCMCDCGEWFDLNDGYRDVGSDRIICKECHKINVNAEDREDIIYSIGIELDENTITFSQAKKLLKEQDVNTTKLKTKQHVIIFCTQPYTR